MINFLKITIVIKIKRLKEEWRQLYDQCQKQKNLKQKKWFKKHVIRYHNNSKSNVPRQPLWNMSASGTFHLYPCLWYHQDTSNRQLYNRFRKNARYQQRFQENRVGCYRFFSNLLRYSWPLYQVNEMQGEALYPLQQISKQVESPSSNWIKLLCIK